MKPTRNLRIVDTTPLQSPNQILEELPISERAARVVFQARQEITALLAGEDSRKLVIVGPCSIHDPESGLEYAARLRLLRERLSEDLLIVMRVYFEKPRTTLGWKGLINDPHLDGSFDIPTGIRSARRLLLELSETGVPSATELLDPIVPQYIADLVSWAAIGARTTESQIHREMASGLSMPVGFKNGTDGGLGVAINAMLTAARPHRFLGVDPEGRVALIQTNGNQDSHLVLRGGSRGPNFGAAEVEAAARALLDAGVNPRVLVDASHDNSGKDAARQPLVLEEVGRQIAAGSRHLLGVMIESHLVAGRQNPDLGKDRLVYGQSITDACVDFPTTERMLEGLARQVRSRRAGARASA